MNKPIINCHIHTFTIDHVPKRFLPFGMTTLARIFERFPKSLARTLRWLWPFSKNDVFERYAAFVETSSKSSQFEVFKEVSGYYPSDSKFIILPMDMEFMDAGEVPAKLHKQHQELLEMANDFEDACLPFYAVDPRRFSDKKTLLEDISTDLEETREKDGTRVFRGIKLYPPLGFAPDDPKLMDLYAYCEEHSLPIMSHCSRGGVRNRKIDKNILEAYTDPDNYMGILTEFPKLRICLAHMGGNQDWEQYFSNPESRKNVGLEASAGQRAKMNWLSKILQMIDSGKFENLYTDVSYTVFEVDKFLAPLAVILRGNEKIKKRVLFGSDYYMTHNEKFDERFLSMKLRHELGEELFDQIARDNPIDYLGTGATMPK